MRSTRLILLLSIATLCTSTACGRRGKVATIASASPATNAAVNVRGLNARMTEGEIIREFGLDPGSAKRGFVQVKDGTSATYSAADQQVMITRSLVSGITVIASGRVAGVWPLGKP